jgi:hypothetical protein
MNDVPRELLMKFNMIARIAVAVTLAAACWGPGARAQQPTAASIEAARELIALKGGSMFEPLIPGVIESVKNSFVPTNPNLMPQLNEVAAQLRKEYDSKRADLLTDVARTYAAHFTEQELKDIIIFYKTPLGKKMLTEEPIALNESLSRAQDWANRFSEEVMGRFRAEMRKKGHSL